MSRVLLVALVLAGACKEKTSPASQPAASPAPSTPAGAATDKPKPEPARPSLPTPLPPPAGAPITVEDAQKLLPPIESKQILELKPTSDGRQVHGTWCMDGTGAEDVAKNVGKLMADKGYTALAIRGDAKKAGVQGDRDGYRMSMIVSASSAANCPAPAHYFASATIFKL